MKQLSPIQELQRRLVFTPDFGELRKHYYIPLFVYDDFKSGHLGNNVLIDRAKYLGKGRTCTSSYKMKIFEKENIPVLFGSETPHSGFALGEVYAIKPDVILEIDEHLCQGMCMERVQRNIFLLDQEGPLRSKGKFRPSLKCFMYIGNKDYWEDITTFPCPVHIDHTTRRRMYTWG